MIDLCELLEWDSAFFGITIARVTVDRLTEHDVDKIMLWCSTNQVDCLYFLGSADHADTVRQVEDNGFRLVDIRLTYGMSLISSPAIETKPISVTIRQCISQDIPALKVIARMSYHDTRFYFDPNFESSLCDTLYETWIEKSCNGYADSTLVAERDGRPLGYITCHRLDSERGQIGLLGVSKEIQGQGIGQELVNEAIHWFISQGMKRIEVVTQARNSCAQRLYQRCGFLTVDARLWYHKWFFD